MSKENFEIGMDASIQDLFDNTSLMDRIRKTPSDEVKNRFKVAFRNDLTSAHVKGHDEGVHTTVLNAIRVLESLSHRAGRKSCVEALRDYFKVTDHE